MLHVASNLCGGCDKRGPIKGFEARCRPMKKTVRLDTPACDKWIEAGLKEFWHDGDRGGLMKDPFAT